MSEIITKDICSKAKPIKFSNEMVKAILNGSKTQTRRPVKPQPIFKNNESGKYEPMDDGSFQLNIDGYSSLIYDYPIYPKYSVGDILYIKEDWLERPSEIGEGFLYRADVNDFQDTYDWHSLKTMPKEAARLFLKVTNVKVQRLQDIDVKDIAKEGIKLSNEDILNDKCYEKFKSVWNNCYSKEGNFLWETNPWVFVYEFEEM